jgi:hypothetical protein
MAPVWSDVAPTGPPAGHRYPFAMRDPVHKGINYDTGTNYVGGPMRRRPTSPKGCDSGAVASTSTWAVS